MPEYLAPGVYVEETSFRSRTIEGVSTTTTAFVGPTLKGPYDDVPELLTSFGDFERIYGGLGNIDGQTNYVAYAVKAFFDNGGSRLYVSRVVPKNEAGELLIPIAESEDLLAGSDELRFIARFPGEGSSGDIIVFEQAVPASESTLNSAPQGSIARLLSPGANIAQPAQVTGTVSAPFSLSDGDQLVININDSNETITFRGRSVEAVGSNSLAATSDLSDVVNQSLNVRIGETGILQTINLPTGGAVTTTQIVIAINQQLRGGYARLTTAVDEGGAGFLAIGTNIRGTLAQIQVNQNVALGFVDNELVEANSDTTINNVPDLATVSIADIQNLLSDEDNGIEGIEAIATSRNQLQLRTTATGSTATFSIRDSVAPEDATATAALGLTVGESQAGTDGSTVTYYEKRENAGVLGDWLNQSDVALTTTILNPDTDPPQVDLITLSVIVRDSSGTELLYEGLGLSPTHPMWIQNVLAEIPSNRADAINNPFAIRISGDTSALTLRDALAPPLGQSQRQVAVELTTNENLGTTTSSENYLAALEWLESLEDISIVAAPGYSAIDSADTRFGIQNELITFASRRRAYQIAVLDAPRNAGLTEVRSLRSRIDSNYAALYYPWVVITNPSAQPGRTDIPTELYLPPSGFICGIYARNDIERGVYKAPANEVIRGALRLELNITFGQQEVLNPQGINCLRFFPGRGYRVWGARLATSDSEVKYVSDRRYLNYLERSIDEGTQFAVFEPNGPKLWTNIRDTISSFLYNEWFSGALLGASPQEAFFVRCDRSTMTQNDLDNGRLICLVGVALQKPAEFVIFRIGQAVLSNG